MPVSDEQFAALVALIEDGELDERITDLLAAIDDRNERRKHQIERLVESIWGPGARVVGGSEPRQIVSSSPQPNAPAPPGYYRAQDGQFYPLPQTPESVDVQPDFPPSKPVVWPAPIESQSGGGGGLGVSPVRDPMSSGGDLGDGDPNIVSTGAQIQRYGG